MLPSAVTSPRLDCPTLQVSIFRRLAGATHGRSDDLVRYLREPEGIEAHELETLYGGEDD